MGALDDGAEGLFRGARESGQLERADEVRGLDRQDRAVEAVEELLGGVADEEARDPAAGDRPEIPADYTEDWGAEGTGTLTVDVPEWRRGL